MEFDWLDASFDLRATPPKEVEESFEDPFAIRLLPDMPQYEGESRFFCLGKSAAGRGLFSVFRTDGKSLRVILARDMTPEEVSFYEKTNAELNS